MKKIKQLLIALTKLPYIIKGLYYYLKGKQNYNKYKICMSCEHVDLKGDKCLIPNTQPCCGLCGCTLKLKIPSGDKCPIGKW